jgi:outer membrane receptor protein involved in Fe transport
MKTTIMALTCLCAVSLPAAVQAEQGQDRSVYLEEIIVTATKREESIQDVPIAVTALDAQALERGGIKDLRDLSTIATSFNMNSSQTESQGSTLRIRGVGTTGNNIGLESAVGVFLDGVYLSRPGVALGDLMDLESVEVLRGPQGTLFGRNTSAGALNIRTKKPNMTESEFFANATAGNHGAFGVQAGQSGPIIQDKLGYRISGAWREQDGFLESTSGAESRNRDRLFLRGQLLWDINERADLRIIADYADVEEQCCDAVIIQESPAAVLGSFVAAGLPADGGVLASGQEAFKDRKSNAEQYENPFDSWGISAELNWELAEDITLTYIGAYRDFKAESVQYDFVGIDVYSVGPQAAGGFETFDDIETFTHELRIAGDTDKLSWLFGAYYSDEEIVEEQGLGLGSDYTAHADAILWNFAFAPVLPAAPLLSNVPMATGGTFGDILAADNQALAFQGGLDSNGAYGQNRFVQKSKSWSFFTHNVLHVTDRLDLVVGLRYAEEDKDGSFEQLGSANGQACLNTLGNAAALGAGAAGTGLEVVAATIGNFSAVYACFPFAAPALGVAFLPAEYDDTFKDDELIYTGKVVYAFTDTVTGYVSFTHGFKSGGFNLDTTAAASGGDPRFDSETIDSWEIGIKSELFDRRVRANLALFDYDLEDFQVLEFTGTQFVTFNVPKAKSQGAELELLTMPLPGLDLQLGFMWADSRYPSDCDGGEFIANVSTLCGADFTNSPEFAITAGFNFDGNIGNDMVYFLNGNMRWEDDRRTSTQPNLDFDIQESNTKINARVGIGSASRSWTLELWGMNITDKQTKNVTFNTPLRASSRGTFLEAPRTYGVTLRTEF